MPVDRCSPKYGMLVSVFLAAANISNSSSILISDVIPLLRSSNNFWYSLKRPDLLHRLTHAWVSDVFSSCKRSCSAATLVVELLNEEDVAAASVNAKFCCPVVIDTSNNILRRIAAPMALSIIHKLWNTVDDFFTTRVRSSLDNNSGYVWAAGSGTTGNNASNGT